MTSPGRIVLLLLLPLAPARGAAQECTALVWGQLRAVESPLAEFTGRA